MPPTLLSNKDPLHDNTPQEWLTLPQQPETVTPIVLAGGPGSRLWPLTNTRPKPMVPLAGKPILEWCLEALHDAGFDDTILVVGHKATTIQTYFGDGSDIGLDITYVHQDPQIGTAHAVATALEDAGIPQTALVLGGDNVVSSELITHLLQDDPPSLAVTKSAEPSKYGVVQIEGNRVTGITEKPHLGGEASISTGVCLLDRDSLDTIQHLVREGTTGLPTVLNRIIEEGHPLGVSRSSKTWLDAVYPWDLVPLTELLLARHDLPASTTTDIHGSATVQGAVHIGGGSSIHAQATVTGPTSIGANVRLEPRALVHRSLILEGTRIGPGSIIEASVLAEGVHIGAGAVLGSGDSQIVTGDEVHDVHGIGAIVGEGATIGPGAVLHPGTIVGAGATIAPGTIAKGRIPDGAWVQ